MSNSTTRKDLRTFADVRKHLAYRRIERAHNAGDAVEMYMGAKWHRVYTKIIESDPIKWEREPNAWLEEWHGGSLQTDGYVIHKHNSDPRYHCYRVNDEDGGFLEMIDHEKCIEVDTLERAKRLCEAHYYRGML